VVDDCGSSELSELSDAMMNSQLGNVTVQYDSRVPMSLPRTAVMCIGLLMQ